MPKRPTHKSQKAERTVDRAGHRDPTGNRIWIFGHHAVAAALGNPMRKILRLMTTDEAFDKLSAEPGISPDVMHRATRASRREIDAVIGEEAVHQGVALLTEPLHHRIEDILDVADSTSQAAVVVLDQVTDPHNVGAIARSAAALGASAVLAPMRHAAGESGIMHKAASGAMDRITFIPIVNVARALDQLKQSGFWIVGLAGDAPTTLSAIDLKGRVAIVLGAEGEGLRRLVRETCDHVARLPMSAGSDSLNVSNAAAIALYERARQCGAA